MTNIFSLHDKRKQVSANTPWYLKIVDLQTRQSILGKPIHYIEVDGEIFDLKHDEGDWWIAREGSRYKRTTEQEFFSKLGVGALRTDNGDLIKSAEYCRATDPTGAFT